MRKTDKKYLEDLKLDSNISVRGEVELALCNWEMTNKDLGDFLTIFAVTNNYRIGSVYRIAMDLRPIFKDELLERLKVA